MRWTSVKDAVPKENGKYVIFYTLNKFGKGEEGYKIIRWRLSTNPKRKNKIFGFWGNCDRFFSDRITHWMPLYEPTKDT